MFAKCSTLKTHAGRDQLFLQWRCRVNSLRLSDVYTHKDTGLPLVQANSRQCVGACYWNKCRHNVNWKLRTNLVEIWMKLKCFIWRLGFKTVSYDISNILFRSRYVLPLSDNSMRPQIARFMRPTWGPPGSCRPQMGHMLAPGTLLSGSVSFVKLHAVGQWLSTPSCKSIT